MARTRSIKPSFFDNEILGDLPPLTRLLFIGLWGIADREGRLEDRPKRIKKELLGYDDVSTDEVSGMLQSLHDTGFIIRYATQDKDYIQVINFGKHQNPHVKEKASEIPPPPEESTYRAYGEGYDEEDEEDDKHQTSTGQVSGKHHASTMQAPPITGNLSPSTGNLPPGKEEDPEEEPAETASQKRFDLFWAAYPKKVGKKAAQKAWKNAKVNADLFDKIMNAVGKARITTQWLREGGRYIPNPSTWLNEGRWDDEIKEVDIDAEHRSDNRGDNNGPAETNARRKGTAAPGFKPAGEPDDD
jgi:hypothetical protein